MFTSKYKSIMPGSWEPNDSHEVYHTRVPNSTKSPYIKYEADLYDDADYGRPVFTKPKPIAARATYIKTEPDLYDDYADLASSRLSLESKASTTEGYLTQKSAHIHKLKRMYSTSDMLVGNCFETTGFIIGSNVCVEVSHMLFDSGAASSFISVRAVREAGLDVYRCKPQCFLTASDVIHHDKYTTVKLVIAGVCQSITAYVDQGSRSDDHHVLLGVPAMKQFDTRSNHCFGDKQETRWSISQNIRGLRRKRYVLRADPYPGVSTMRTYPRHRGLRIAMEPGETAKERDARETLERRDHSKSRYADDVENDFIEDQYIYEEW